MRNDEKAMDSQSCDSNLTDAHDQKEGRKMAKRTTQTERPNSNRALLEQNSLNGGLDKPFPDLGWAGGIFLRKDLPEPPKRKPKSSPEKR